MNFFLLFLSVRCRGDIRCISSLIKLASSKQPKPEAGTTKRNPIRRVKWPPMYMTLNTQTHNKLHDFINICKTFYCFVLDVDFLRWVQFMIFVFTHEMFLFFFLLLTWWMRLFCTVMPINPVLISHFASGRGFFSCSHENHVAINHT